MTSLEAKTNEDDKKTNVEDMSLLSITSGENARGIPVVKFIDDVGEFSNSFQPPASAELIIGAYSELHSKFKTFETSLTQKSKPSIVEFDLGGGGCFCPTFFVLSTVALIMFFFHTPLHRTKLRTKNSRS